MRIAIAGGTGALGRLVTAAVQAAGHDPVVISRGSGQDLMTGRGLTEALEGAHAVIDASATSSTSTDGSRRFFTTVTRNQLEAERASGVAHHVAISIIGAREVDANYYAGKAAQERMLEDQQGGWSLLRTAQFHDFVPQLIAQGRLGPLQGVPTMRSQPISTAEVAQELVAIASGAPRGRVPDLAGPQEENMADLVRRYLRATGQRRPVIQLPLPGAWGRGMRDGSLLPRSGARRGTQTFEAWLEEKVGHASV